MEKSIKMVSASSEALHYLTAHPDSTDEELMQHIVEFIMNEDIRDERITFGMIAAATETYRLFMKNPKISEKECLRKVIENLPKILESSAEA